MKSAEYYDFWKDIYLESIRSSRALIRLCNEVLAITKHKPVMDLMHLFIEEEEQYLKQEVKEYISNEQKRLASR